MTKGLKMFVLFLALAGCWKPAKQVAVVAPVNTDLPVIDVTLISGEVTRLSRITGKTILVFFSPECDHCQREAEEIRKNLEMFAGYSIYFIAAHPLDQVNQFAETYGLKGKPDIYFASADINHVRAALGPIVVPTMHIYSEQGKLVKVIVNEATADFIQQFL